MDGSPVIAGTDGSQESLLAVEWAAREAVMRGWPLRIVAVPALPPRMAWQRSTPGTVTDTIRKASEQALASAAALVAEAEPDLVVDTVMLSGAPAPALVEAASDAPMLVVGSRGSGGFGAIVLGSASRYVAAHAPCPVVVAREGITAMQGEVVVGVRDLDQPATLGFAFEEARLRKARLHAVYAWPLFLPAMRLAGQERPGADADAVSADAAAWLADLLSGWRQKYPGVQVSQDVVHAQAGRALAGASARADLVVLGRNSAAHAGGSGTGAIIHAVLHHAHSSVAVVPE
jgi:nucleotide-binding universal stress UspA family protein